jgi:hypothetical protein
VNILGKNVKITPFATTQILHQHCFDRKERFLTIFGQKHFADLVS